MNASQVLRTFCLLVFACWFTGCAVLTIDVDVYKGPLANDDTVQMRQVVELAGGAKDLLIRLRDRLESKDAEGMKRLLKQNWYKADFVPPKENRRGDGPIWTSHFEDEQAAQVNAVLSLYKDIFTDRLAALFHTGEATLKDYDESLKILNATKEDLDLWRGFESGFIRGPGDVSNDKALENLWTSEKILLEALKKGYEAFLVPPPKTFRSVGAKTLFTAHCNLAKKLKIGTTRVLWNEFKNLPELKLDGKSFADENCDPKLPENTSANSLFRALEDRRIVEFHSRFLFKSNAEARRGFINRAVNVARSFTRAREALAHLWQLTVQFILIAPEFKQRRSRLNDMSQVAAELATKLIDHEQLRAFLFYADRLTPPSSYGKTTIAQIPSIQELKQDLGPDFQSLAITELLVRKPAKTVGALVEANTLWGRLDAKSVPGFPPHYLASETRRFGIVTGPVEEAEGFRALIPAELGGQFEQLSAGAALGLEQGRPPLGLESLINDYNAEDPASSSSKERFAKERRLWDGLVGFAEKILMLGNFNILFEQEGKTEGRLYVSLLQAIGNSLLTQVNELQTKKRHIDASTLKGEMEARALKAENEPSGQNAGNKGRLIEGLKAPMELPPKITTDASQVMDLVISKLQYEHVQALRRGATTEATHLEAAIEAASAHRANMVYIRPASFYLRNSFLFTGLQKDSTAVWKNMLTEHALRQFWPPTRGKEAEIIGEFDKQYWQNVNTVRLAGGGQTNYVVAKDDVGNWYVKGFSSDPKTIIEGAKSLALFAAKGAVSIADVDKATSLLKRKPKDDDDEDDDTADDDPGTDGMKKSPSDKAGDANDKSGKSQAQRKRKRPRQDRDERASVTAQGSVLEDQRNAAIDNHKSRTGKMLKDLVVERKDLVDKQIPDLRAFKKADQTGILKKEVLEKTTIKTIETSGSQPREHAYGALKTVVEYRDDLLSKMSKEKLKAAKAEEEKKAREESAAANTEREKTGGDIPKLETASDKEKDVAQKRNTFNSNPTEENKAALASAQADYDTLLKNAGIKGSPTEELAKAKGKQADLGTKIEAHNKAAQKAGEDLKKIELLVDKDIEEAKVAVRTAFRDFLTKYVGLREGDLENYRTRLRAIRGDKTG